MNNTEVKELGGQDISFILEEYLRKKNMTQTELVRLCKKRGYQINQGSVSKVLKGKKKMSLEECRAFCDVLEIPPEEILFPDTRGTVREDSFFCLSDRRMESAKGIIGDYNIYFLSTAREEKDKIINGTMKLYYGNSCIHASIDINIRNSAKKNYSGYLWFAEQGTVAYIIVKRFQEGELSILAFRYREFVVESMKCRKALCLTTSAGEIKEPVIHRLAMIRSSFISDSVREELMQKVYDYLKENSCSRLEMDEDLQMFQGLDSIGEKRYE